MAKHIQSTEELIRVADEWLRNFCPSNLVIDGPEGMKNGELIIGRCLQRYADILTISGMTETVRELAAEGKLALIPEPKVPTQAERAAEFRRKEFVRIQKEQEENRIPFQDRVKAAEKAKQDKEKATQQQASAKSKRDSLIADFSVSAGPGRYDEGCGQYFQSQLRAISAHKNGQADWVGTLALVEEALKGMAARGDDNLRREHQNILKKNANAQVEKERLRGKGNL